MNLPVNNDPLEGTITTALTDNLRFRETINVVNFEFKFQIKSLEDKGAYTGRQLIRIFCGFDVMILLKV